MIGKIEVLSRIIETLKKNQMGIFRTENTVSEIKNFGMGLREEDK